MQEKDIYKISLILVIVGLIFLFFYSGELSTNVVDNIDNLPEAEKVTIQGKISQISVHDKVTFLKITGEKIITTDVILFSEEEVFLEEGNFVQISGIIEDYQGKKEVIASDIIIKG